MSLRYFFGDNADRPIRAGGKSYEFSIIGRLAGCAQGVVAVPEDEVEVFNTIAMRYGIEEITKEAYDEALVKTKQTPHLPVSVARVPQVASLKGGGAVVVSGSTVDKKAEKVSAAAPVDLDEAIVVEKVKVDDMPPTEDAAASAGAAKPRTRKGGSNN